jgi:AraC-like DNA-binding protein/mannose-6-phosphate isomerase-like protein (cupin superfamily)
MHLEDLKSNLCPKMSKGIFFYSLYKCIIDSIEKFSEHVSKFTGGTMDTRKNFYNIDIDLKINLGNSVLNILYFAYLPPSMENNFDNHSHSSYELHFIPKGKGILNANGTSYEIYPGIFYLTGPDIYHEQRTDSSEYMSEFSINFEIIQANKTNSSFEHIYNREFLEITDILLKTSFWIGEDKYDSISIFKKIFEEMDYKLIGYCNSIRNYITQIIINSVRCFSLQKKASYSFPQKTLNDKRRLIIDNLFSENFQYLTIEIVSKELGLSSKQSGRIIEQYYNMSFTEKLLHIRFEKTKELLKTTDMTIEDISDCIGFSSSSYFSKIFKSHFGVPPGKYRTK